MVMNFKEEDVLDEVSKQLSEEGKEILTFGVEYVSHSQEDEKVNISTILEFMELMKENEDFNLDYLLSLFVYEFPEEVYLKNVYRKLKLMDKKILNEEIDKIINYLLPYDRRIQKDKIVENKNTYEKRILNALKQGIESYEPVYLNREDLQFLLEKIPNTLMKNENKWVFPSNQNLYEDFSQLCQFYDVLPKGYLVNESFPFFAPGSIYENLYSALEK